MEDNEFRLEGVVGEDFWSDQFITIDDVREKLKTCGGSDVTIWLNSPGGDVIVGSQIYTALKNYKGNVTVRIDGMAASAASVIAMGANVLEMSPTAYLMIHRSSTVAWGNAGDMEESMNQLKAVDEGIVEAYRIKTGMSRNRIMEMMEAETIIPARAAVRMGFADTVLYSGQDPKQDDDGIKMDDKSISDFTTRFAAFNGKHAEKPTWPVDTKKQAKPEPDHKADQDDAVVLAQARLRLNKNLY